MPSQRKRIGFLPRAEVQNIIDQICKHNKLSQSKVTGILVEEALNSRGLINNSLINISEELEGIKKNSFLITNDSFNSKRINDNDELKIKESYMKGEVQMINDFIEFKFFKDIMNKNKKNI